MEHKAKLSVALTHIEKKTSYGFNGEGNNKQRERVRERGRWNWHWFWNSKFIHTSFRVSTRGEKSEMWRGDAKIESWGTKIYGTLLENRKGKQNLLGFVCMQMFMIGGIGLKQLQEEIEAELRNLWQREFSLGIPWQVQGDFQVVSISINKA